MNAPTAYQNDVHFFQELATARRRLLLVDYDSTMAQASSHLHPAPCPTLPELLDCIMTTSRTRVVFVTSRETEHLLGAWPPGPRPDIWGAREIEMLANPCEHDPHRITGEPLPTEKRVNVVAAVLPKLAQDSIVAYLGPGDEVYMAVPEKGVMGASKSSLPQSEISSSLRPSCRTLQFLMDWLRACAGEIC